MEPPRPEQGSLKAWEDTFKKEKYSPARNKAQWRESGEVNLSEPYWLFIMILQSLQDLYQCDRRLRRSPSGTHSFRAPAVPGLLSTYMSCQTYTTLACCSIEAVSISPLPRPPLLIFTKVPSSLLCPKNYKRQTLGTAIEPPADSY